MTSIVIAIVTWNNSDDAVECADSLLAQRNTDDYTVLFVDNDSKPSELAKLRDYISDRDDSRLDIMMTGQNGGTAGGFTAAARWARDHGARYVGALNADATADDNWLAALIGELESHSDTAIVTGKVLHADGKTIDSTGDFYTTWGLPAPRGRGLPADQASDHSEYVFGATGGAYLARTKMYDDIGYYDLAMFMYYEDVDLSFRAQLAGYKIRYTPEAIVYHKRGASSDTVPGLATYHTFKNLPILFTKNVPLGLWPSILPRFTLSYLLILGNAMVRKNRLPAIKGWLMSIALTPRALAQRRRIQSNRKVDAGYINSIILHDIPPDQSGLRKFRGLFTRGK